MHVRAIALAVADLICTKTLQKVVDRVVATTQVAAIVAKRKGREIHCSHLILLHIFTYFNHRRGRV